MKKSDGDDTIQQFEDALRQRDQQRFLLRLFVTGTTPRSVRAIAGLRSLLEEVLSGRYELEVIDIYQQPELCRGVGLVAAPTLIKQLPEPVRRMVGDLADRDRILRGLDLKLAG
jgi:circadian clock protein KaiB